MKIEFNDGESVDLEFNEAKHQYHKGGEFVPAVTSVLSTTIAKQQFLMPWAVKMGAEWFKDNSEAFSQAEISIEDMVNGIKRAYKKKSAGLLIWADRCMNGVNKLFCGSWGTQRFPRCPRMRRL